MLKINIVYLFSVLCSAFALASPVDSISQCSSLLPPESRLLLISDAYHPQVHGVTKTLGVTENGLKQEGHTIKVVEPSQFKSFPIPGNSIIPYSYSALLPSGRRQIEKAIEDFNPDYIHVATPEGPIGMQATRIVNREGLTATSSYHTHLAQYLDLQSKGLIPEALTQKLVRNLHNSYQQVMATTEGLSKALTQQGFRNTVVWGRGVDVREYRRNPNAKLQLAQQEGPIWSALENLAKDLPFRDAESVKSMAAKILQGPVFLYVGRVSIQKNIEAFLNADLPGVKLIVGPGPSNKSVSTDRYLAKLNKKYFSKNAIFVGEQSGQAKIDFYSVSDVFVFPSRTDTFGNVNIEAMATGLPVVLLDPKLEGIVIDGVTGYISRDAKGRDLSYLAIRALDLDPQAAMADAQTRFTPQKALHEFESNLVRINH